MTRIKDLLRWMDEHSPFKYCASWDNCGLLVGHPEHRIERILVALDVTSETLDEAIAQDCQAMVTHHPILFQPIKAVRFDTYPSSLVARAIRSNIHLIAAHTNLDASRDGINTQLCELLGLEHTEGLEMEADWQREPAYRGLGRVGMLPSAIPLSVLVEKVSKALQTDRIRYVGDERRAVQRVAVCSGSGGSLLPLVLSCKCDVYLTGDLKYHEAQHALEENLCLVDMGHFSSERIIVPPLVSHFQQKAEQEGCNLVVLPAQSEDDPFRTLPQAK